MGDAARESGRQSSAVEVGSWVLVRDGDREERWRIVSAHEGDAARQLMSEDAPMARALLGHRAGERVRVRAPAGSWPVVIVAVD